MTEREETKTRYFAPKYTLSRRSLDRFRRGNPKNQMCWDRNPEKDSFFNVVDAHNHFRPFNGPSVPFNTYFQWMQDAGILFSTIFGIGQKIQKTNLQGKPHHGLLNRWTSHWLFRGAKNYGWGAGA